MTPPAALRPLLRFNRMTDRALGTVRDVLDRDDDFRTVVADAAAGADMGRGSELFLARPDGWQEELALLTAAAVESDALAQADRDEASASRRVRHLTETVERLRQELDAARSAAETVRSSLETERTARREADAALRAGAERQATLEEARQAAVRQLKELESRASARVDELRELRSEVRRLTVALGVAERRAQDGGSAEAAAPDVTGAAVSPDAPGDAPRTWAGEDRDAAAAAVGAAARAAETLGEQLAAAAAALGGRTARSGAPAPAVGADEADRSPRTPPSRRVPLRLRRGVMEGTPEAVEQYLRASGVVVVVDGYNVSMTGWPALDQSGQRARLIALLAELRVRTGAEVHVVFDGDDDGSRPSVSVPLPVRVHFSPVDVEADDVVLDMVASLPAERPVVVVSSDRRVQDGARGRGANVVGSAQLLRAGRR